MPRRTTLNRVMLSVKLSQAAQFVEVALYSGAGVKLTTTEAREIPPVGLWEWSMTPVDVPPGVYHLVLTSTSTAAQLGVTALPGAALDLVKPGYVANPAAPTVQAAAGTLVAKTYTYSLSYVTGLAMPPPRAGRIYGETAVSPPAALVLGAAGGVRVSWPTPVPAGVTKVRIYGRDTSVGPLTMILEVDAAPGQWTDDGSAVPGATLQNYVNTSRQSRGLPTPATLALSQATATAQAPALTAMNKRLPHLSVPPIVRDLHPVHVYGGDPATQQPWGWNQATGKLCMSYSSGEDWQDRMPLPSDAMLNNGNVSDLLVYGRRVYVLSSTLGLCRSSDLTAAATWENIACPIGPDLRRASAIGRPMGMEIVNGHLFMGEYSQTGGEFGTPGNAECHVLKLNLNTMTWSLSERFQARHHHSFYLYGTQLWASFGDAEWGPDVGLWVLNQPDIGAGAGGTDKWTRWTRYGDSMSTGYSGHYPIDFVIRPEIVYGGAISPAGIYQAADRSGKHLLYTALAGGVGEFNINALTLHPPALNGESISGETVAGLSFDAAGNAYYFTQESARHAIWMSPPPYSQTMPVKQVAQPFFITRVFKSGEHILSEGWLILPGRFEGQA